MINQAYLTDGTDTYNIPFENVKAEPIVNANTAITIGGIVNSQADTERLKIITTMRVPQEDIASLKAIYTNFSASLKYKPSRLLYDKTTIEEIQVVMSSAPKIKQRAYGDGAKQFYITFEFEEIIEI